MRTTEWQSRGVGRPLGIPLQTGEWTGCLPSQTGHQTLQIPAPFPFDIRGTNQYSALIPPSTMSKTYAIQETAKIELSIKRHWHALNRVGAL